MEARSLKCPVRHDKDCEGYLEGIVEFLNEFTIGRFSFIKMIYFLVPQRICKMYFNGLGHRDPCDEL